MKKLTLSFLIAAQCMIANAASITEVTYQVANDGRYQLVFKGADALPSAFTTKSPDTLVLDFANTASKMDKREITVAKGGVYDIDLIEGNNRTRAVINLAEPKSYQIIRRGHDVVVFLKPSRSSMATASSTRYDSNVTSEGNIRVAVKSSKPISSAQTSSRQFTFSPKFVKKGQGLAVLSFAMPVTVKDVQVMQDGNKIIASIPGYFVAKSEQKRMDVRSYRTPVQYVDVFRTARGTNVILNMVRGSAFDFSSYQNGNFYKIQVRKLEKDNKLQEQMDKLMPFSVTKHYKGAPLSLNFQDIEVRAVLQIIAEFTNTNIVVSDAVTGNITLRLDNVPWDQALDIILKTKGLGMRKSGSVIYVAPASELDQQEISALETIQKRDQLVPTQTVLIPVKYGSAAEIASILEQSRASNNRDYVQNSILSSKGTVRVDARTNTLLVSDIPSKIQAVRDLVAELDEPVRQVLIDARLVLTSDSFTSDIGSRLGISFVNQGSNRAVVGSGTLSSTDTMWNSLGKGDHKIEVGSLSNRLGVNLPVGSPSYGLAILGKDFLVDLELSALQTEGKAEILSSPRIVTQDGKKARIAQGTQIPYTSTSDGGTNVEFKNAELSLDVTPRIAPDNRVDMILDVKKDSPNPALSANGNIGIDTNQLQTNVLVDNAETIVLGGIYQQNQSISSDKVPVLGDIPVIGNAFKRTNKKFNKSELLIFVTPRIIDNKLTDYDKFSNLRN